MPYRGITTRGITLLCFPAQDAVLATIASRHAASLQDPTPTALQALLRDGYPQAIVRPREPFAALHGGAAWYVYRDGRYSPFASDDEQWWEAEGCAFIVIEPETGNYLDANEAAAALVGMDPETLLSMRSGDLVDPAARETLPWVWSLFGDVGVLHSTTMLRTPDGRRVAIEYHMVRDVDDHGKTVSYMRAAPLEAADLPARPDTDEDPGP